MPEVTLKNHEKAVHELNELENSLIELISLTDNTELKKTFLLWQEKRASCNTLYNEWLKEAFR